MMVLWMRRARHGDIHHLRLGNGAAAEAYLRIKDRLGQTLKERYGYDITY